MQIKCKSFANFRLWLCGLWWDRYGYGNGSHEAYHQLQKKFFLKPGTWSDPVAEEVD